MIKRQDKSQSLRTLAIKTWRTRSASQQGPQDKDGRINATPEPGGRLHDAARTAWSQRGSQAVEKQSKSKTTVVNNSRSHIEMTKKPKMRWRRWQRSQSRWDFRWQWRRRKTKRKRWRKRSYTMLRGILVQSLYGCRSYDWHHILGVPQACGERSRSEVFTLTPRNTIQSNPLGKYKTRCMYYYTE